MATAYTIIDIPEELWKKFKATVNKTQTLSEAIIDLIKEKVKEK